MSRRTVYLSQDGYWHLVIDESRYARATGLR
jgi:hypothetical protein